MSTSSVTEGSNILIIFLGILPLILCVIDNSAADPGLGINVILSDDDEGLNSRTGQLMARAKNKDNFLKRMRRNSYGSGHPFLNPGTIDPTTECYTRSGEEGTCVLYYRCDPDSPANTVYGDSSSSNPRKKCPHYLKVCCKDEDLVNLESIPQCGWSNPGGGGGAGSRSGDTESQYAQFAEFPWMVAVLRNTGSSGDWDDNALLGGGTLIHPSVVLTAAHKLTIPNRGGDRYNPKELKCRAGEHDTHTTQELFLHQDRDVDRYIVHEQFDPVSKINDITLLIMKVPFALDQGDHISAGCLSSIAPTPAAYCYSAGWGAEYDKNRIVQSSVMKKVKLYFFVQDFCTKLLWKSKSPFRPHESLICMNGNERLDTCEADSGSPVVCPISTKPGETRYAVYGMAVSSIECDNRRSSGLAANVPNLRSWVDSTMIGAGFDTKYYTI